MSASSPPAEAPRPTTGKGKPLEGPLLGARLVIWFIGIVEGAIVNRKAARALDETAHKIRCPDPPAPIDSRGISRALKVAVGRDLLGLPDQLDLGRAVVPPPGSFFGVGQLDRRMQARALPLVAMVSDKLDRPVDCKRDALVAAPKPPKPRTSSLSKVVQRHRYTQSVSQHPSQATVPPNVRVVTTAAAKTIVVVDDDADQVDLAVMALEAAGHTAHGTTDSTVALELIVKHLADILVVDFMMPKLSGGAIARAVRADPSLAQTKIILMSGTQEEAVRADFDQFDVFLQKPIAADRLLWTVEDL